MLVVAHAHTFGRFCAPTYELQNSFAEDHLIVERIVDAQLACAPLLRLNTWVHVTVVLCGQLSMEIVDPVQLDNDVQARRPVAVMLAQEDDDLVAREGRGISERVSERKRPTTESIGP